ncbi:hypothetical protein Clacol_009091 [Clathrus columnatus]|uniref:Uncharacterized protein n=1 Tax=Clathrus columnatus TaxID=1419009 RepID=A0AAV5AMT2_9AGAM|nr:hypothetical protein Clacol_009091 [Clathrus columnatus]
MTLLCRLTFSISEFYPKYLTAKIFSADATEANVFTHELQILLRGVEREVGRPAQPPLLILAITLRSFLGTMPSCTYLNRFHLGLHGLHYCFLTCPFRTDVDAFRASAPTGKLGVHIVKPIVAGTIEALQRLQSYDIIHTEILFLGPSPAQTEAIITRDPALYNGVCTVNGIKYPTLETQPLQSVLSWDASAFYAETIQVVLSGLGTGLWLHFIALTRGFAINIFMWPYVRTVTDRSVVTLFAVTGETLSKDIIDQSPVRDKFFDPEGILIHSKENIYPPQPIIKRLRELCKDNLTEIQINAAAKFINDRLWLDPLPIS